MVREREQGVVLGEFRVVPSGTTAGLGAWVGTLRGAVEALPGGREARGRVEEGRRDGRRSAPHEAGEPTGDRPGEPTDVRAKPAKSRERTDRRSRQTREIT